MKKRALIVFYILACILAVVPVYAQKKQTKQTDADVPLHLMQPEDPKPKKKKKKKEKENALDKMSPN